MSKDSGYQPIIKFWKPTFEVAQMTKISNINEMTYFYQLEEKVIKKG